LDGVLISIVSVLHFNVKKHQISFAALGEENFFVFLLQNSYFIDYARFFFALLTIGRKGKLSNEVFLINKTGIGSGPFFIGAGRE